MSTTIPADTTDARSGRCWVLGDDINTDYLAPGKYMKFGIEDIARHCLEDVLPPFAAQVQAGDVIIAGRNFGAGSSREQAVEVLRHLGVQCVVARSFAGLFYRNGFNLGLPLLLGACRTWGVESENRPQRDQFLPDLQPNSRAIGQKDGEKWAAAVDLQPTISKTDRLLGPATLDAPAWGIAPGTPARLDLAQARLQLPGGPLTCQPIPPHLLALVADGGLVPHLRKRIERQRQPDTQP